MKRNRHLSKGARASASKRSARDIWSREKRRVRRGGLPRPDLLKRGRTYTLKIVAPTVLGLHEKLRNDAIDFLGKIRDYSSRPNVRLYINFSPLQQMFPNGAVLLLAEIDRALARGRIEIQISRPKEKIVDEVFQQIGIYSRLKFSCDVSPNDESVIHWRSATGVASDGESGGTMLEQYDGRLAGPITKGLYGGIIEAMTNTVHHAYDGDEGSALKYGIGRRWWMLSEERDGKLSVSICDLGIGIPRSLPRSRTFDWQFIQSVWKRLGVDRRDHNAIRVALEIGKTRTDIKGRGKGLSDIVRAVNLSEEGRVLILSNKGSFASFGGRDYGLPHSKSIRGTLINWQVPIAE